MKTLRGALVGFGFIAERGHAPAYASIQAPFDIVAVVEPCAERLAAVDKALSYFEHNRSRMDYKRYRAEGYFIGSGVVEAGCKKLIGGRLKQSGMFWKLPGGSAVVVLRCALETGTAITWNQFWNLYQQLPLAV